MRIRQESQKENAATSAAAFDSLLLAEGLTVGALILSGICLMGTNQNTIQRAVVLTVTVICAGLNGAFDALVCIVVHSYFLLLLNSILVWLYLRKRNMAKFSFSLLFLHQHDMITKETVNFQEELSWLKSHLLFYLLIL